jgi:hypothetical protein
MESRCAFVSFCRHAIFTLSIHCEMVLVALEALFEAFDGSNRRSS